MQAKCLMIRKIPIFFLESRKPVDTVTEIKQKRNRRPDSVLTRASGDGVWKDITKSNRVKQIGQPGRTRKDTDKTQDRPETEKGNAKGKL